MARVVASGFPHHITQRGNRSQRTFFSESDYHHYFELLVKAKHNAMVEIWAYCFMPNHVHLIAVPAHADSLRQLFSEAHRQYTRRINRRFNWRGHLWQERFHSFVMDENHLSVASRYVELNPVRAQLCNSYEGWKWSSVHAHLQNRNDGLVTVRPMLDRFPNWKSYLSATDCKQEIDEIRVHTRTGRPSPDETLIDTLEDLTGRILRKQNKA
jgi:putative transposase